jgi:hypothetical protein
MLAVHGHAVAQEAYCGDRALFAALVVLRMCGGTRRDTVERGGAHHRVWSVLSHGTAYFYSPLAQSETRVAINMHSFFGVQEASTECRVINSFLRADIPFRINYAF